MKKCRECLKMIRQPKSNKSGLCNICGNRIKIKKKSFEKKYKKIRARTLEKLGR